MAAPCGCKGSFHEDDCPDFGFGSRGFIAWSEPDKAESFEPSGGSIWYPRWLQPLVFWVLRRLC
jgi:hypothetical protein